MNKQKVAEELVKLAKELIAVKVPRVGDRIDVSDQHDSEGNLYMPSQKFGARFFVNWQTKPISSEGHRSMNNAVKEVDRWVDKKEGSYGYVFNRKTGKVLYVAGIV